MTLCINMTVKCLTRVTAKIKNPTKAIGSLSNLHLSLSLDFGNTISHNCGRLLVQSNSLRSSRRIQRVTRNVRQLVDGSRIPTGTRRLRSPLHRYSILVRLSYCNYNQSIQVSLYRAMYTNLLYRT